MNKQYIPKKSRRNCYFCATPLDKEFRISTKGMFLLVCEACSERYKGSIVRGRKDE